MGKSGYYFAILSLVCVSGVARADLLWGLTATDELVKFDSATPTVYTFARFITGLQNNEHLLDIDVNPIDGNLYGLSSQNRIYVIDAAPNAGGHSMNVVLDGTGFGIDWNPLTGQMQVGTNLRQSFHSNTSGVVTLDPDLAYAAGDPHAGELPSVTDLAYSNSFPGAGSTTLYGLDNLTGSLVTVDSVSGAVHTVGSLSGGGGPSGFTGANGFEIKGANTAYAALQLPTSPGSTLFSIDLATGHASQLGQIGGGGSNDLIIGIAAVPEPASLAILGIGALALMRRRKR
jgi:hypothetical protein